MKNKFKIIIPILALAFSLVCANAIMPVPKLDLEEYEITSADKNKIYVEGTISIAKGQQVTVRMENSYTSIPIVATKLGSSGSKENFQLKIPTAYISQGTNKFYVRSEGLRKVIHPSNMREVVVKISDVNSEKKSQTINANNKSVQVGNTVSIDVKTSSGLPLTYNSSNTSIATVSSKGVVTGKKAGTCKITITQNGNSEYKSAIKVININVIKSAALKPAKTSGTYTIVYNKGSGSKSKVTGKMASQKVEVGKQIKLKKCEYKKKGYEFIGWSTTKKISKKTGFNSNFQLGKVKYKNKAQVKNLTTKNKTIHLYAVWKATKAERIAQTAEYYSWPYKYRNNLSVRKYKKGRPYRKLNTAKFNGGACCCHWAKGVVIKATGHKCKNLLPNTRSKSSAKRELKRNVKSVGKYKIFAWNGKTSQLKRGDIVTFVRKGPGGHVMIYLGDKRRADAGYKHRYAGMGNFSGSNASIKNKWWYYVIRFE